MSKDDSPIRAVSDTVEIVRFQGMTANGDYPKPKPFGGMGAPVNQAGFSDHFPIGMHIELVD
jgi:hypothetical protein